MSELKVYEAYICSHEFLPEDAPKDCDAIVKSNSRYEKDGWWDNAKEFKCYIKSEADKVIEEMEEKHKKEVDRLLMKISGLELLVKTADKIIKQKGGFKIKDVKFGGVKLEGINTNKKETNK